MQWAWRLIPISNAGNQNESFGGARGFLLQIREARFGFKVRLAWSSDQIYTKGGRKLYAPLEIEPG